VHDLLAHLAERMIEMNTEKNAEIKVFLGFLEGEIGAAVDDMANKTAVREYYNHEFRKLVDILVKNKKKLKTDMTRRVQRRTGISKNGMTIRWINCSLSGAGLKLRIDLSTRSCTGCTG